jgi:hypothetical protein
MRFPGRLDAVDGGSRQSVGEGPVDQQDDRALVFYDLVALHSLVREHAEVAGGRLGEPSARARGLSLDLRQYGLLKMPSLDRSP